MKALFLLGLVLIPGSEPVAPPSRPSFFVHEWGTFTSLQNEAGESVGGINTDDEPVPAFVHDVAGNLLLPSEKARFRSKSVPNCHPHVTMRLETPVLYFHAPPDFHGTVDVQVDFKGGWLTQFYPVATTNFGPVNNVRRALTTETVGRLQWLGLKLNAGEAGPATHERVWLAPREVEASMVQTPSGEAEKFLFYRGVGHLDAPLRVTRSADGETLKVAPTDADNGIGKLWLVDVLPGGRCAWRTAAGPGAIAGTFAQSEYTASARSRLREDLRADIVAAGLFPDEADALLNTWEVSYFRSPGQRLFFLVPQPWTDRTLPLSITGSPVASRVMVGRIELVTPKQRAVLAQMAASGAGDFEAEPPPWWMEQVAKLNWIPAYDLSHAPIEREYLSLGRFRNALLLEAQRREPGAVLGRFTSEFGLQGFDFTQG